jgi:probable F420-dependent oxidoreductase
MIGSVPLDAADRDPNGPFGLQVGAIFPQGKLDPDRANLDAFARGVEAAGYRHLGMFDHVLGADRSSRPEWNGVYDSDDAFHEPLITLTHIAALTRLELLTCVMVLPQRQTALVAKQAATLDHLSGGRLRLGVGIGWNEVEYRALGTTFRDRSRRFDDQIELLRELWTRPVVDWDSDHHRIDRAGINPLPPRRIPIWLGTLAQSEAPLHRIGRLADGWIITAIEPGDELRAIKAVVDDAARAAGRDPADLGFEGRVRIRRHEDLAALPGRLEAWAELGATHVAVETRRLRLTNQEHTELLGEVAAALELAPRPDRPDDPDGAMIEATQTRGRGRDE